MRLCGGFEVKHIETWRLCIIGLDILHDIEHSNGSKLQRLQQQREIVFSEIQKRIK